MDVSELTTLERLQLCRRAIRECGQWLRHISQVCEPADMPLRKFLSSLALASERNLDLINEIELEEPPGSHGVMEEEGFAQILKRFFPSMRRRLGEGYLGRETGMHFAECLEEELGHFYQFLAEATDDPKVRSFFLQAGREEESHLDIVRHTLLK